MVHFIFSSKNFGERLAGALKGGAERNFRIFHGGDNVEVLSVAHRIVNDVAAGIEPEGYDIGIGTCRN